MAEVAVTINGRDYKVRCADGEEERLTRLAAFVDEQFADLFDTVGDVGDLRLMVMTSLMIADKVFDASAEIDRLRAQVAQAQKARRPTTIPPSPRWSTRSRSASRILQPASRALSL